MRLSNGFGKAVFPRAAERPADGIVQRRTMSDGNVERFDSGSRSQDRPDYLPFISQLHPAAAVVADGSVLAAEPALGRPYRR